MSTNWYSGFLSPEFFCFVTCSASCNMLFLGVVPGMWTLKGWIWSVIQVVVWRIFMNHWFSAKAFGFPLFYLLLLLQCDKLFDLWLGQPWKKLWKIIPNLLDWFGRRWKHSMSIGNIHVWLSVPAADHGLRGFYHSVEVISCLLSNGNHRQLRQPWGKNIWDGQTQTCIKFCPKQVFH
jgi:hypothetical protein